MNAFWMFWVNHGLVIFLTWIYAIACVSMYFVSNKYDGMTKVNNWVALILFGWFMVPITICVFSITYVMNWLSDNW